MILKTRQENYKSFMKGIVKVERQNKLISIIVPVYNVSLYLDKCIESILNQNYKNIELILIDDGSTDNSYEICEKWEKTDKRIKLIKQKNKGVSSARNKGLDNALGDYISFIDSDDIVEKDIYTSFIKEMTDEIDIIRFRCRTHYGKIKTISQNNYEGLLDILKDEKKYDLFFKEHAFGSVCFSIFNRNVIEGIRFNEEFKYGEDYLFYFYVINKSSKIFFSDFILYNYMVNHFSATRKKQFEKEVKEITDHIMVDKIVYDYVLNKGLMQYKDILLGCTINAFENWQKNIAKKYSYTEYVNLLNTLGDLKEWNEFFNSLNDKDKKIIDKRISGRRKYYIVFKISGKIKSMIKTILR